MARPILLIGLGGFGKWVVTAFKTRILDAYKEKPPDVDWISFDLARQEIPPVQFTRFELGRAKQETLDFSDTSQEFRLFGGDFAYHVGRAREGQHDPRFLGRMTKDDADILVYANETGVPAAERRHASMIQFQLNLEAIDRVIQQKLKPDSMVFLVNSIAGGTGTGTFIDFSLLLRRSLARTKGTLISILLLPQGFARVKQNEDMRPLLGNCYAAFRELLRLQYPKGNVQLCFSQTDLALKQVTRPAGISLADLVYVIDGTSLPENTEYYRGVVPAIAGFIEQSFLAAAYENELVAKGTIAATSFDQGMKHALENFSGVGATEHPFNAFAFSSFGTHRMVFDRDAVKTEFAHEIATRMFGQFLADSWLADPEFAVKQYTLEPRESTRFDKEVVHDCVTKLAGAGAALATYRGLRQRLEDDVKFPEFDLAGIEPAGRLSETKALADKREEFRLGQPGERFAGQARPTFHSVCDYYLARYTTQFRERLAAHVLQILGNGRGTPDYGRGSLRAAEHFVGALRKWYTLFVRGFPEAGVKARFAEACELADAAEGRLSDVETAATGFYEQNRNARGGLFRDRRKDYLGQRDGVAHLRSREVLRELVRQVAQDNLGYLELLHQDLMDWIGTFKHCVDNLKDAKNDLLEVRRARQEIVCDEYLTTSGDEVEGRLFELIVSDEAWNALAGPGAARDAQTARWRETAEDIPHPGWNRIVEGVNWEFARAKSVRRPQEDVPQGLRCLVEAGMPGFPTAGQWSRDEFVRTWNYELVRHYLARHRLNELDKLTAFQVLMLRGDQPGNVLQGLMQRSALMLTVDTNRLNDLKASGRPAFDPDKDLHYFAFGNNGCGEDRPLLKNWVDQFLKRLGALPQRAYTFVPDQARGHALVFTTAQYCLPAPALSNLADADLVYRDRIANRVPPPLHILKGEKLACGYEVKIAQRFRRAVEKLHPQAISLLDRDDIVRRAMLGIGLGLVREDTFEDSDHRTHGCIHVGEMRFDNADRNPPLFCDVLFDLLYPTEARAQDCANALSDLETEVRDRLGKGTKRSRSDMDRDLTRRFEAKVKKTDLPVRERDLYRVWLVMLEE